MPTRYIFLGLGGAFLLVSIVRLARAGWRIDARSKAHLLVGIIFVTVGLVI
ncbi:MAG TPA: hypothetical protein VIT67_17665 [Povalibacter sp.]